MDTSKRYEGINPFLEANKAAKIKMQNIANARKAAAGSFVTRASSYDKPSAPETKKKATA